MEGHSPWIVLKSKETGASFKPWIEYLSGKNFCETLRFQFAGDSTRVTRPTAQAILHSRTVGLRQVYSFLLLASICFTGVFVNLVVFIFDLTYVFEYLRDVFIYFIQ